jgi:hypothetical protein
MVALTFPVTCVPGTMERPENSAMVASTSRMSASWKVTVIRGCSCACWRAGARAAGGPLVHMAKLPAPVARRTWIPSRSCVTVYAAARCRSTAMRTTLGLNWLARTALTPPRSTSKRVAVSCMRAFSRSITTRLGFSSVELCQPAVPPAVSMTTSVAPPAGTTRSPVTRAGVPC